MRQENDTAISAAIAGATSKQPARRGGAGAGARASLGRLALKQALPLALSVGLFVWLRRHLAELDLAAITATARQVSPLAWLSAACLSAVSFWAVGRYDRVVHAICRTGIGGAEATRAGAAAIALAQVLGFGVLSSALVRWRLLPGLGLLAALRLSLFVSLSFLAGWAVVSAGAVLLLPDPLPFAALRPLAWLVLAAALALGLASLWRPGLLARLPSLRAMGLIVMLVLLDTSTAGAALYVLLPAQMEAHLPLATLLTAYLLALGAGLLLGAPGGVGAFEVVLLALLPQVDQVGLLGAVLAFRMVYYALPALLGAAVLIRGPLRKKGQPSVFTREISLPDSPAQLDSLVNSAREPEAALLYQGRLSLLQGRLMVAPLGQSLVALRGPLGPLGAGENEADLLESLARAARARFLSPALYKAPPRLAAAARRAGWQVMAIARDGWIDPQGWKPEGRAFRQLRRKLRKAEQAGVTIRRLPPGAPLPLEEMARINAFWTARRGGERGFSMGVFDPAALRHSEIYLAWQAGRLVGFLTLMQSGSARVLDLMRQSDTAPDGTMHLALSHAIDHARRAGLGRLSLAALPAAGTGFAARQIARIGGAAGLAQFKQSFAPRWRPLYIAAPSRAALALAALEIGREILRPAAPSRALPQLDHAANEFAPGANPWHMADDCCQRQMQSRCRNEA